MQDKKINSTRNVKIPVKSRFDKLEVIEDLGMVNKSHLYKCRCECGAELTVRKNALLSGKTGRCASCARRINYQGRSIDGYYVEELIGKRKNRTNYLWRCRCINCGAIKEVDSDILGKGHIAKCKCRNQIKPLSKVYINQIF